MKKAKKDQAIFQIMFYLIMTTLLCFVMNNAVLGASAQRGSWVGGDVFCQLFAYFSNSLVSFAILAATLATFERRYAVIDPDKHLQVFTPINTRFLLIGLYMLSVLLCAGPLYGWGEYSNFKGVLKILISVTLDDHSLQNSTLSSILCQHVNGTHNNRLQDFSARALDTILTQWPHTYRRSEMTNCMNGQVLLQIRAENTNVADDIHNDISSNRFNDVIIKKYMNGSASLGSGLSLRTFVNRGEFQSYRDVYITFQSIGVCSLDFSPTNAYVISSTVYILCTTVIGPLLLMILNSLVIFKRMKCPYLSLTGAVTYLRCVNVGGIATTLCCVPYYMINFMNMHGVVINRTLNLLCTAMFYSSSLCITLPFLIDYVLNRLKIRSSGYSSTEVTELQSIAESTGEC
uniref:Uncharacterized protein LOC111109684 n=1 Tax=Crassostrea virginica TaxID=6565 RepID=A0A8B8BEG0_CRAVI|nr:uncharacterized protein LOC111109684 [Crassostrea virginica]